MCDCNTDGFKMPHECLPDLLIADSSVTLDLLGEGDGRMNT